MIYPVDSVIHRLNNWGQTICLSETICRSRWFVRPLLWWENGQWNKYNRETSYFSFNWLQLNNHPKIRCKIQIMLCKKEGFQHSALFQSQQWFGLVETTNVTENNNITDHFMMKVPVTLIFFYFWRKVKSSLDTNSKKTIELFTSFHGFWSQKDKNLSFDRADRGLVPMR